MSTSACSTCQTAVERKSRRRFKWSHRFLVQARLYDCEFALGHCEQALELMASPVPIRQLISGQVDCLLVMKRNREAIDLLERHLHLDSWRGHLRRRLESLTGTSHRGFN
jgi:hypothetical protein